MIAAGHDVAAAIEGAEYIRARIPGAILATLDAGHISNVE